jgi:ketosteroid isomerase-like protein
MRPREILKRWVEYFNQYDYERLGELYAEDCINHQTPNGIIKGKENIKNMFKNEFEQLEMVCIFENIFEDSNVGMLEWKETRKVCEAVDFFGWKMTK